MIELLNTFLNIIVSVSYLSLLRLSTVYSYSAESVAVCGAMGVALVLQ